MILTAQILISELLAMGVREVAPPRDSNFFCPSPAWLASFGSWLCETNRNQPWIAEKFDCDDYAIRAIDRATDSLCGNGSIQNCGHTFCYAEIELSGNILGIDGPGNHAVNFVRCSDGWWYFEPQMGLATPLPPLLDDGRVFSVYDVWL